MKKVTYFVTNETLKNGGYEFTRFAESTLDAVRYAHRQTRLNPDMPITLLDIEDVPGNVTVNDNFVVR